MTDWRPISEAPKDGDLVLMWPRSSEHATASWSDDRWCLSCCGQTAYDITHFMPLPPPPDAPGSPQLDQPKRSRHEAALDIAVQALRQSRRDLIVAITACCELEPEEFSPENANVVHRLDRALTDIAALVPDAVKLC